MVAAKMLIMTWLTLRSSNAIYACPSLVQSNVNQQVISFWTLLSVCVACTSLVAHNS